MQKIKVKLKPAKMKFAWLYFIIFFIFFSKPVNALDFTIQAATPSGNTISLTSTITGATSTNCPDKTCYLFAALRRGVGNYFGETQNNQGEWIAYTSNPTKEFIKSAYYAITIIDGGWNGILQSRFNPADGVYTGPGEYTLSLMRFTGNGQSPAGDSPIIPLTLTEPMPSPSPSPNPSISPSPSTSTTSSSQSPTSSPPLPGPLISPMTTSPSSKIARIQNIVLLATQTPEPVLGTQSAGFNEAPPVDWQLPIMLLATGTGMILATAIIIIKLCRKN